MGSSIHKALERFYRAHRDGESEPAVSDIQAEFSADWHRQLKGRLPVLFKDAESPESLGDLGKTMLAVFHEKAPRFDRVVDVEIPISPELRDPDSGEAIEERFVAVLDAIVQDADGRYHILEHKTSSRRFSADRLAYDIQLSAYAWAGPLIGLGNATITVQLLLKSKSPDFELLRPMRTSADSRDFLRTAVGVASAIRADLKYLCRGWWCSGCEYSAHCFAG